MGGLMSKLFLLWLVVFSISGFAAETAKVNRYQAKIDGMVCNFCVESIKIRLKKNKEVDKVEISLEKKLVAVTTFPGQDVSKETIEESIRDTGYTALELKRLE